MYIRSNIENNLSFISDFGIYRIDKEQNLFIFKDHKNKVIKVEFEKIDKIKYEYKKKPAWLLEFVTGVSPWLDKYCWHTLYITSKSGDKFPLFIAGQYQPNEMIMYFVKLEKRVLKRFRMYQDISKHVQTVIDEILVDFKSIDNDIMLSR